MQLQSLDSQKRHAELVGGLERGCLNPADDGASQSCPLGELGAGQPGLSAALPHQQRESDQRTGLYGRLGQIQISADCRYNLARDGIAPIDAEREHLSARLLHWMSPGQYLEHATAGGYEPDRDPLIKLKREEILVEHRYFAWQEAHHKDRRARALDPEQTLVEQAYAAAMSARWSLIHKRHRKLKKGLKWIVIGFQVDPEGETHLQALVRGRIARMEQTMQKAS